MINTTPTSRLSSRTARVIDGGRWETARRSSRARSLSDPVPNRSLRVVSPRPLDHPNVAQGAALLRLWPEVLAQFVSLTDTVSLFLDAQTMDDCVVGSICGQGAEGFGSIAATVNHHAGFAEALVHEMAHHKLRALGIQFDGADRLILNSPEQLFPSPIRYDCLRPMTAVVHAQYSYTYIIQLDLKILQAREDRAP